MAPPSKQEAISSPLVSAFNNIVNTKRSQFQMRSTKNSYDDFMRFMQVEVKNIESIKLPREKKISKLANINVASTFGTPGSLLSSLASGALDVAGFIGNMFGGRKPSGKPGAPIPKNKGFRIGGVKALGIANAAFAGLDFATGLAEGESVGKAAAGAGGALAGSLIGGATGQALIPIPGLGLVVGSMAGNFLGGYLGDRAHEAATGTGGTNNVEQKQEQKLAQLEAQQKASAAASISEKTFPGVLDKFDTVVYEFEVAAARGLFGSSSASGTSEDLEGLDFDENSNEGSGGAPSTPSEPYDGPISKDTFFPLPRGIVSNRSVGVQGGEYGAPRNYGGHSGQDIGGLPPGSPVVAWKTGKVRYSGSVEPGDTIITIDHGNGEQSVYKHVVPTVAPGTVVYGGQQIASLFAAKAYPEHLHFEVWKNGSHTDPNGYISAAQKISSPLSPEKAKAESEKSKVTAQSGVMGTGGKPTAVLMAGTNDYGDPSKGALGVKQAIKNLQDKGFHVVVVPPSEVGQTAEVSKQVQEVATQMGATVRKGQYKPTDNSGAIGYAHLTQASADAIARDYKGATFVGDSNAQLIPGAKIAAPSQSASTIAGMINQQISSAGPAVQPAPPQPQVQATSQQPVQPQQVQQYPSYSMPTQNVTVVPMMMGSPGGGPQQRPVVISSSDGSSATIMPSVSKNQMLNSLFTTALLTNLSGT